MEINPQPSSSEESRLIPWWSVILAIAAFVCWQALVHLVLVPRDPNPKPLPLVIFWGVMVGFFFSFYMLMIGYVNRDAKRRGMNSALWTLIMVLLLASGIGFIVYFLLRQPIVLNCPKCSEQVESSFNFCPKCHFQLNPMCPECRHAVRAADTYCAHCGHSQESVITERYANLRG
ncbi:MAG TPA: zinc ribbon domain-containing protein [Terriglobales bacterium]|nr:zinc ribbon domain-containing protein [Terriglobales bacterium]